MCEPDLTVFLSFSHMIYQAYSNISAPISILGYAMVEREMERYPQTMGYYVSEFSAYKLN